MSKNTNIEPQANEGGELLSLQGPYRRYQPADTFWRNRVGKGNALDKAVGYTVAIQFITYMFKFHYGAFTGKLGDREKELFEAIEFYKKGKFYLGPLPPLGYQLYSLLPNNVAILRKASLCFASATLFLLYLTLRRTNANAVFALLCVISVGYLPTFQREGSSISVETLQWFFLAMSIFSWQSLKCARPLRRTWVFHFFVLAIALGLGACTKFIGVFTWVWICILSFYSFWQILGDVKLTTRQLLGYSACQVFFLGVVPLIIFTSSYTLQLNNWQIDTPSFSTYMSSDFKSFLRGPLEQPKQLYYGSIITMRHMESLGGYLHSHNYTYKTGSQQQQVTLVQLEDDSNNEWIIEHRIASFNNDSRARVVQDLDRVKLRHRSTGKLLRASSAKPPVSEQEYDSEVSCTGDIDYQGDSDETWTINAINGAVKDPIEPSKAVVKFTNQGHRCVMISHDIRLPEWAFNQQEVLCLDPATQSRALFQIETVKLNISENVEFIEYGTKRSKPYKFGNLIMELLQKQYKYNYYEKNLNLEGPVQPQSWPFYISRNKFVDNIWLSPLASLAIFFLFEVVNIFKWNPWKKSNTADATPLNFQVYQDFGVTCVLGWLLHYYPFVKSPHQNLDIAQYMPSLLIGQLLVFQTFDVGCKWNYLIGPCICCYVAFVMYI